MNPTTGFPPDSAERMPRAIRAEGIAAHSAPYPTDIATERPKKTKATSAAVNPSPNCATTNQPIGMTL
jgi:hypothetical protein